MLMAATLVPWRVFFFIFWEDCFTGKDEAHLLDLLDGLLTVLSAW